MSSNFITTIAAIFLFFFQSVSQSSAGGMINGAEIKDQAQAFFDQNNLGLSLSVSDQRTFFYCSSSLKFKQRLANDWSTIVVTCPNENWSTLVRSKSIFDKSFNQSKNILLEPLKIVTLTKNLSVGQVIIRENLELSARPEAQIHGAYKDIDDIVGRKAKTNLAAGTIIKSRHLEHVYSINKDDTVLVTIKNNKLSITTSATALENGQLGDMIKIRNSKSQKILKAIVTGRKKVSPITNM